MSGLVLGSSQNEYSAWSYQKIHVQKKKCVRVMHCLHFHRVGQFHVLGTLEKFNLDVG